MADPGRQTLLVVLAHPDDEVLVAGTIMASKARGDRVVLLWLTRGEMTEAFGPIPPEEVGARREELAREAADQLEAEARFLDFGDTRIEATPGAAREVAQIVAEYEPDGVLTWGESWLKGHRHPDHAATGKIARDAITLARIAKVTAPDEPYRGFAPLFTIRGVHSSLPWVGVDVTPFADGVFRLGEHYRRALGFGDRVWLERRLRTAGKLAGVQFAEVSDAWETTHGTVANLLPAVPLEEAVSHPDRELTRVTGVGGGP